MKPNHLFTGILVVTAMLVASCSTPKLAQRANMEDDVYNTTAQARTYKPIIESENVTADTAVTTDYYGTSDPYYDMDYSTRINRFYYANPWRTYYDGYYGFSPYSLNSYWRYSFNNWYNPYSSWAYYGSPYYNNYWGPYSYYNPFYYGGGYYGGGYYGGGYYGGGYYGGGTIVRNNPNYGPRPTRGMENGINRANGTGYYGGSAASTRPSGTTTRSRAEMYNPSNGTVTRPSGTTSTSTTPSRPSNARPTRTNDAPSRPTYNPPVQSSPPPSSGGSRSGGGSSSSGSGGGSSRPTRGGGR